MRGPGTESSAYVGANRRKTLAVLTVSGIVLVLGIGVSAVVGRDRPAPEEQAALEYVRAVQAGDCELAHLLSTPERRPASLPPGAARACFAPTALASPADPRASTLARRGTRAVVAVEVGGEAGTVTLGLVRDREGRWQVGATEVTCVVPAPGESCSQWSWLP